jgi:hypothetical protein
MIWTVVWHQDAIDKLADIWLQASDRGAVTLAAHEIEQALRQDADKQGTDFFGDRLYVEPPLSVVYRVFPPDCLVRILDVEYHLV